jgi:hypothetical protein
VTMELNFLKPLFDRPGPWASVYLDTSRTTEDAAQRQQLLRRSAAGQLIDQGADGRTCSAVVDHLAHEPVSGAPPGRALFATEGEVALDLPLGRSPTDVETSWSVLPHVAPLIGYCSDRPRCMVAYIDRTGADFELRDAHRRETAGHAEGYQWQGRGHRSIPTDRYEWHYRNKVENTWNQTAEIIAEEIVRAWPDSGADLLILVGDPRERRAVHHQLPEPLRPHTVETERGSRSPGASRKLVDAQIDAAREDYARRRLDSVLDLFRTARGRPGEHGPRGVDAPVGEAVEGVPAVVEAARGHQVATLLLGYEGADPRREVWIGPGSDQLGVQRSQVQAMSCPKPVQARADDALLRSIAASHAEVLLVPEGVQGPVGGLGAVLRWS